VSDPFLAEIRIFPTNFAPAGWALCNGQILPISQNTALFALLGTTYGGTGTSNFALPNLQASAPMHFGQGTGLSQRDLGESGGEQTVTLLDSESPQHSHTLQADPGRANLNNPGPQNSLARSTPGMIYTPPASASTTALAAGAVGLTGGSLPHNNMQPYLTLNFCIALQGIFPARS